MYDASDEGVNAQISNNVIMDKKNRNTNCKHLNIWMKTYSLTSCHSFKGFILTLCMTMEKTK